MFHGLNSAKRAVIKSSQKVSQRQLVLGLDGFNNVLLVSGLI